MSWTPVQHFEQNADYNVTGAASTSKALTSPVAVGDIILVATTSGHGTAPTTISSTVTDSLGNAYTRLLAANGGQLWVAAQTQSLELFFCMVTVPGTPTITFRANGATVETFIGFVGDHFTGSDATSTRRDSKGATQASPGAATDAIATASVGAQSGDLLYAVGGAVSQPKVPTAAGTGFTAVGSSATLGMLSEYKTATGAQAATMTDASAVANTYLTIAIAITPAPAAGNPPRMAPQQRMC